MPRGTTLAVLRSMLKKEIGYNLQTGVATAQDNELNGALANMQQWLWTQYQWPFLYSREDIAVSGGGRYVNLPTVISLDYPTTVEVKWGLIWYPVDYGIKGEDYRVCDPDRGVVRDPIAKWQLYSSTQFEVWPMPASAQTLRFWGTKSLTALASDNDTALLDDLLIVLFVAADKLERGKQKDAQVKRARATALFNRLRTADRPNTIFTLGGDELPPRRTRRLVTIASNPNQ